MRCGTHYTVYTCLKLNADSVLVDYGVDTCIVDTSRMQRVSYESTCGHETCFYRCEEHDNIFLINDSALEAHATCSWMIMIMSSLLDEIYTSKELNMLKSVCGPKAGYDVFIRQTFVFRPVGTRNVVSDH